MTLTHHTQQKEGERSEELVKRLQLWPGHLDNQAMRGLPRRLVSDLSESAEEITRLTARIKELEEALGKLGFTAALLQHNSESCAELHYGQDISTNGLPGWLLDTKADIDRARTVLGAK